MRVCLSVHTCVFLRVYMSTYVQKYMFRYTYVNMCVRVCIWVFTGKDRVAARRHRGQHYPTPINTGPTPINTGDG